MRGVFVYGTLRPGGWNHDQWLAPFLTGPCRPSVLDGFALHHYGGLPAVVAAPGSFVVGEVAALVADRYEEGLAVLDFLEGTAVGHYVRVVTRLVDGEEVWLWVAGEEIAAELGAHTLVPDGDWLEVAAAE